MLSARSTTILTYLPYNINEKFEGHGIMHKGVSIKLAQELSGTSFAVCGTQIWADVVTVFNTTHSEGKGSP